MTVRGTVLNVGDGAVATSAVALTCKPYEVQERVTTATMSYRKMDMRFWLEQADAELKVLK